MRKLKPDNAFGPFELAGAQEITIKSEMSPGRRGAEEFLITTSNFCSSALE